MIRADEQARWPALTMTVLLLGYAAGKVVYAVEGRLGFPSGPVPSPAEHARYAAEVMPVGTAQWCAAGTGLLAALVVLATATRLDRRVPRVVVLLPLVGVVAGVGAGAVVLAVDGFVGIGIGWRWWHGVVGLLTGYLLARTLLAYVTATRRNRPAATGRAPARR